MNNIYQKIELLYNAPKNKDFNYEQNICVELINDYSYYDLINAFIEFSQCIGFDLTKKDIIEKLDEYIKENKNE